MVTVEQTAYRAIGWHFARQIRDKVFVQEQGVDEQEEYDVFDMPATHYLAYIDHEPVGTCRWRMVGEQVKLERFAVLKEFRGKGVGRELVKRCLQDISIVHPNTSVYLHAQLQAEAFYAKLGFQPIGEWFWEAGIEHVRMELG